jgi:hypothetical protein
MHNSPLDIHYAGKFLKSRNRTMIKEFTYRFYTPFSIVLWIAVAFNLHTCVNTPALVVLISVSAAALNSHYTYYDWLHNILLLTESQHPTISYQAKISVAVSDFMVHFTCTLLSFWWVDDLHECIPMDRENMGMVWLVLFLLSMAMHIIQYRVKNNRIETIVKNAYRHVQSSDV